MKDNLQRIFKRHPRQRDALIPVLQDVQEHYGYLPLETMKAAAHFCRMAPVEVFGVATFYAQFKFTPAGKNLVMVCQGTACHVMGGARNLEEVQARLGIQPGETTPDGMFRLETVACIGACALAPAMVLNKTTHGRVRPEQIAEILNGDQSN